MVTASNSPKVTPRQQFARLVRERFLAEAGQALIEIGGVVQDRLTTWMDEPCSAKESQDRRDAWMAYKKCRPLWMDGTTRAWRQSLSPGTVKKRPVPEVVNLQLVDADVMENKILCSRLVASIMDKVGSALEDLRLRIQLLEGADELSPHDVLLPDVLVTYLIDEWVNSGMRAEAWAAVSPAVQKVLIERLQLAYSNANEALIKKGVLPVIELKDRVKSPAPRSSSGGGAGSGVRSGNAVATQAPEAQSTGAQSGTHGNVHTPQYAENGGSYAQSGSSSAQSNGMGMAPSYPQGGGGNRGGHAHGAPYASASGGGHVASSANHVSGTQRHAGSAPDEPFWKQSSSSSIAGGAYGTADETRMMTAMTPIARARSRAQGVIGQIRRLFISHAGGDFGSTQQQQAVPPTPALRAALTPTAERVRPAAYMDERTVYEDYSPAGVARVASDLREKTTELKKKAETKGEKATIEIVALMFQAILAEERIPPGIRVWFARLQMPVLRLALEDPDFLATTTHPARLLIDRMGSCVMGFEAAGVQGKAMELEIKRIVQVIEQYPETGKKVYQVVYEEFQKFLSKFLTEKDATQKVVSVAQQVEQRETLTIQYTIEMRNMLKDVPVRDEIREFLFKVWAEVLAVAAVRSGPQHANTLMLKKSATDLLWAASAKPNRADRAKVIQDLPNLLQRLRSGMTLLAMPAAEQDAHIKAVSDTLADAFMSKTQAISQAKIEAMAQRLGNLEDFVSENGLGDLPLDSESIEMMLGVDASSLEVVRNGGSRPTPAMVAWAQELQVGSWFTLDHNNRVTQVQFAWRSERKHLNLFASSAGKSFLIQGGRLAAYLQAGLLLPQEEEALTVRATRDALTKIEANPERLMN